MRELALMTQLIDNLEELRDSFVANLDDNILTHSDKLHYRLLGIKEKLPIIPVIHHYVSDDSSAYEITDVISVTERLYPLKDDYFVFRFDWVRSIEILSKGSEDQLTLLDLFDLVRGAYWDSSELLDLSLSDIELCVGTDDSMPELSIKVSTYLSAIAEVTK